MDNLSNPYSFPPPILRDWSRTTMNELGSHSLRALWEEANFLVFSNLQSGVHPQVLEGCIRGQLRVSLSSYYRLSYLLCALRIFRNLCSNNVFEKLPIASQYRKLRQDRFLLARFEMEMYNHYRDLTSLRLKAVDGDFECRLTNFAPFDDKANGLLRSVEQAAQRKVDEAYFINRSLVRWSLNSREKEIEYAALKETWGKSVSRACKTKSYYHVPKQPANTTRDTLRTPPPRILKAGGADCQVMNHPASPDAVTKNEDSDWQTLDHPAGPGATVKKEKLFDIMVHGEKDPFYELGDVPRLLPRGADPLDYLTTFGYPPPPLFMIGVPRRNPSPSDFGIPFI